MNVLNDDAEAWKSTMRNTSIRCFLLRLMGGTLLEPSRVQVSKQ